MANTYCPGAASFSKSFPFHLVADHALTILQIGPSWASSCSEIVTGASLTDFFTLERPRIPFTSESLNQISDNIIVLENKTNGLKIRYQVLVEEEHLFFVGSPMISGTEMFEKFGLKISDFAPHDALPDVLFVVEPKNLYLKDIKNLVKTLEVRTTELGRLNDELEAVVKQKERLITDLESNNAEMQRFTYTVSHDLKSPLITIKGFLGLLENDIADGDEENIENDIKRLYSAADNMTTLLDELLELSRIGRVINQPVEVPLAVIAKNALSIVAGQIQQRGVEVALCSDLPSVFGDPTRLLEVFQNMLDNAVKYMGDQENPRIEIGVDRKESELAIFVKDNGIGIEKNNQEKVFGLFEKLNPRGGGTGIGLALVKRIIEVHNGRVWVESEGKGKGSTFFFTVNLPDDDEKVMG